VCIMLRRSIAAILILLLDRPTFIGKWYTC
jgi:hypothetical protein